MSQDEISAEIVETVQQHRIKPNAFDLVVSFKVPFDALQSTRCCATRHASAGQIEHKVQTVFTHIARRGLNAATMPVERGPNRTKTSQEGWDEMRRPHCIGQREVAEPLLLFGVERGLEALFGLLFKRRFRLSSVHGYQILGVHDRGKLDLPLKARTKWVC